MPSERLELSRTMFTDPSNQPVYQFQHDGKFPYFLGISCIVAADLAEKCTIQLAYAIGVARPLSFYINTHDTGKVDSETLIKKINSIVDLTPRGIRDHLNLHKPIYKSSAAYGHFGREPGDDGSFSWEKTDLVDQLKNL